MKKKKYPYVVFRVMAAVYIQRSVRFVEEPAKPLSHAEVVVHCPGARRNGRLTAEARRRLIEQIQARVERTGYCQCVVFGPRSALYLERGRPAKRSRQPPSGGVMLKKDVVTEDGQSILK